MHEDTATLLARLDTPDPRRERARARQAAVWRGESPDYLPLLAEGLGQPWDGSRYTLAEQVADPSQMLYEALQRLPDLPPASDSVLSLRPQMGVGFLPTVFGVDYELSGKWGSPWVTTPLSKARIAALEPDTLPWEDSLLPAALRGLEHLRTVLGDRLGLYLPDTQGPFDIAHQVRGHDLLTDLYDDPPFAHHLLELATHVYVEASLRLKAAGGEPLDAGHHTGCLWMAAGGVRLCEDSGVMLSPGLLEEFALPYDRRALAPFGGGWVHWCGESLPMVDAYLALPEVRGVNQGTMTSEQYRFDPQEVMPQVLAAGKAYFGLWPRRPEEDLAAYYDRVLASLGGARRGLILQPDLPPDTPPAQAAEQWYAAQDRAGLT